MLCHGEIKYCILLCIGRTPLLCAARNAQYEVIERILQVEKFKFLLIVYVLVFCFIFTQTI